MLRVVFVSVIGLGLANASAVAEGLFLAPGKSIFLLDPRQPDLQVEVRASQETALDIGHLIEQVARGGVLGGLAGGQRRASFAEIGPDGRIVLRIVDAAPGPTAATIQIESGTLVIDGGKTLLHTTEVTRVGAADQERVELSRSVMQPLVLMPGQVRAPAQSSGTVRSSTPAMAPIVPQASVGAGGISGPAVSGVSLAPPVPAGISGPVAVSSGMTPGNTITIQGTSARNLNWQTFSVQPGGTVGIVSGGSPAAVLNGLERSTAPILGVTSARPRGGISLSGATLTTTGVRSSSAGIVFVGTSPK